MHVVTIHANANCGRHLRVISKVCMPLANRQSTIHRWRSTLNQWFTRQDVMHPGTATHGHAPFFAP